MSVRGAGRARGGGEEREHEPGGPNGRGRSPAGATEAWTRRVPGLVIRENLTRASGPRLVASDGGRTGEWWTKHGRRDGRGWRLMRAAVRPHTVLVWLGIGAGLVWTVARVAIPALTGRAIDEGIAPGDYDVALEWITAVILVVGAVQAVCTGLRRYAAFGLA